MPTLLYGLTLAAEGAPEAAAVRDAAARVLDCGALRAIVATVAAKPAATLDAVRAHDAVLRRAVDAGATVAAVRFGQLFDDDDACCGEVVARAGRVRALLSEHEGCVEMRILLPVPGEEAPRSEGDLPPGPGRAYLESLRPPAAPLHLALKPALGALVRQERVEGFVSRKGRTRGVAFAHLVPRAQLDAYREAIRGLPALAEARVVGPLPLYSFAEPAE